MMPLASNSHGDSSVTSTRTDCSGPLYEVTIDALSNLVRSISAMTALSAVVRAFKVVCASARVMALPPVECCGLRLIASGVFFLGHASIFSA